MLIVWPGSSFCTLVAPYALPATPSASSTIAAWTTQPPERRGDDVAAVAAAVPADERREGRCPTRAVERPSRPRPADKLERDRAEHEGAEGVGDEPGDARSDSERE